MDDRRLAELEERIDRGTFTRADALELLYAFMGVRRELQILTQRLSQ